MRLFPKFTRRTLLKSGSMGLLGISLRDSSSLSRRTTSTWTMRICESAREARPWVYWYFMDGHLTPEGMEPTSTR